MTQHTTRFLSSLILLLTFLPIARGDLIETFSGSGSFAASGGPFGFDQPGWIVLGNPGTFSTNPLGEEVYEMGSETGQDSLNRLGGGSAFASLLEVSLPSVPDSFSGIRFGVVDSAADTVLIVMQPIGGNMVANLQASLDGDFLSGGTLNLGPADDVDRVTFLFDFQPDLIHGGGLFSAAADVNELGNFQSIGSIDGTFYNRSAASTRQFSLNTFTVSNRLVTAQFDRFALTSIPEPSAFGLAAMAAAPLLFRRRQRAVANRPRPTNQTGVHLPENILGCQRA